MRNVGFLKMPIALQNHVIVTLVNSDFNLENVQFSRTFFKFNKYKHIHRKRTHTNAIFVI